MVFSSNVFLFVFLPCVLFIYYLIKGQRMLGNVFLTIVSLGFYAWGEPKFVFVMMLSIFINWLFGIWVDGVRGNSGKEKLVMALMVIFNIGLLGIFKYLAFFIDSVNQVVGSSLFVPNIALPIGISFFTFQAMSYVIDVKRGNGEVQRSLLNVALYISFFPQLIAGPIVRYQTVADEIKNRQENLDDFIYGARRFLVGLSKKILLANNLGIVVDTVWTLNTSQLSAGTAWIAAFAYMLQVYFDFAGYSDMAIGLGRMFGFHFLENFNFPFLSKSIGGFWRRWHISLGSWFRDYLYIPLGGSRVKSVWRLIFNTFVVWSLTGLWHGAAWTYVIWGFSFFVMIMIERLTGLGKWMERHAIGHAYAIILIVFLTIIIRCSGMANAAAFYSAMFGFGEAGIWDKVATVIVKEYGWFILLGVICSLPMHIFLKDKLRIPDAALRIIGALLLMACTVISISYVATDSYNPFIYFNF